MPQQAVRGSQPEPAHEKHAQQSRRVRGALLEPEDFILHFAHLAPDGAEVLDAAAGSGRHALFLARRHCRVVAIDRDPRNVAAIRDAATGLAVQAIEGDIENFCFLPERFDAIVNTFFLFRPLLPQYLATLRPNGLLFFRTFTTDHIDVLGNEKPRRDFLLRPGELRAAFQSLNIVHYEEKVEGARAIATLVGRKIGNASAIRLAEGKTQPG